MSYKIMCDLDDVVFNFVPYFIEFTNQLFNHFDNPIDIYDWNWWECENIDLTFDEFLYGMKLFGENGYCRDIPVFNNVVPHLLDLRERGADIYYVSDRPKRAYQETLDALVKNHLPHNYSLILCKAREKKELVKKLGINIVIDDKFETILDCATEGIQSVLMLRSHNLIKWNALECRDNITAVSTFREFANIVKEQLCQEDTQGDSE